MSSRQLELQQLATAQQISRALSGLCREENPDEKRTHTHEEQPAQGTVTDSAARVSGSAVVHYG